MRLPERFRAEDSKARRFLAWLERPAPRSWTLAMYLFIVAFLIFIAFQLANDVSTSDRQARDEWTSCHNQSLGLPANKQLAQIVQDVQKSFSLVTANQKASEHLTPGEVTNQLALKMHLDNYLYYERQLPNHRDCGPRP